MDRCGCRPAFGLAGGGVRSRLVRRVVFRPARPGKFAQAVERKPSVGGSRHSGRGGAGIRRCATAHRHATHLTPLASDALHSGALRLLVAELRLVLRGYRWWWYAVSGGLLVAQFAAPLDISYGPLLAVAWIWPIFVWSALGTREARFGTKQLLFSCARILSRQFPAAWIVGVLVAALTGLGTAIRLALAGQSVGLFAWVAGVLFIPSLALALGVWGGHEQIL